MIEEMRGVIEKLKEDNDKMLQVKDEEAREQI